MRRFEITPDIVFLNMLDDAIEQMIDEIDLEGPRDQDESFAVDMPCSSTGKRAAPYIATGPPRDRIVQTDRLPLAIIV